MKTPAESYRNRSVFAAILVAACSDALTVVAGDWPEFRGPTGQGISTASDLPLKWSSGENVVWRSRIAGKGWSSPVVKGDRVLLTTAVSSGRMQSLRTVCIDARTGKENWNIEVFKQNDGRTHSKNSHASPTPLVDGEHVFVHFGTHGAACLTLDGDIVWKTQKLVYRPQHGNGGSPILVGDLLIVSCDGSDVQFVAALERSTGKIRWKKDRPQVQRPRKFAFSTPLAIQVDGKTQVVSPGAGMVVSYEPETGREIWKVYYDGYSVIPRPVFSHGLVFVSTSYGSTTLLAIRPTGTGDVTDTHVAWKLSRGAPHTPSPLAVGDELYIVSDRGIATCLDVEKGTVHWQERLGGAFSASPIYADGRVYFQSEEGETIVVRAGTKYDELARNDLKARTLASIAVDAPALLIRTEDALYRIAEK